MSQITDLELLFIENFVKIAVASSWNMGYVSIIQWVQMFSNKWNQDAAKTYFRYICVGSLDDPEALPPKGEFFCKARASWMPEIPSEFNMLISWLFLISDKYT